MKIRNRAGILTDTAPRLKREDIAFIKMNLNNYTNAQLLSYVNSPKGAYQYTLSQFRHRLMELGIKRGVQIRWSDIDTKRLKAWYPLLGDVEIATYLNEVGKSKRRVNGKMQHKKFTKKHINKKRQLMGWHRTPEQIQRIISDNILKFPHIVYSSKDNAYTRGHRKLHAEYEVIIRKDSDGNAKRYIKLNGLFRPFTRWNFEQQVRKLLPGEKVYHKDGNILNDSIDNYIAAPAGTYSYRKVYKEKVEANFLENASWINDGNFDADKFNQEYPDGVI